MASNPCPDRVVAGAIGSTHRPEIDGLRALAVGAVMLFHAQLGLPGGFLGVDVFFVISGYLIAGLIGRELAAGTFRLAEFWERRIRRIAPALALATAGTFLGGWWLLLPEDFAKFGGSLAALGGAASNVFFWATGGYFDRGAATKPLLHTWSLSVEEQFYVLFPLAMIFLGASRGRRGGGWLMLGAVSLGLSVWLTRAKPTAAFYLLPTRGWELLVGALLREVPGPERRARWRAEAAAWAGLGLMVFSWARFSPGTAIPGLAAGVPCLGAALTLWGSQAETTLVRRALGWRPLVFVGLISYGLYLWHWPLIVFADYWNFSGSRTEMRLAALALAVVAAVASWRFVERPIRERRWLRRRGAVYALAAAVSLAFGLAGLGVWATGGVAGRWSPAVREYARAAAEPAPFPEVELAEAAAGKFIELGAREPDAAAEVLVWGDSHAMVLLPLLDELGREARVRVTGAVRYGLAPLVAPDAGRAEAAPFADAVLRAVNARKIRRVVLAAAWPKYTGGARDEAFVAHLRATVAQLSAAGAQVWIVGDVPLHPYPIPKALAARARFGGPTQVGVTAAEHARRAAEFARLLDAAVGGSVGRLDPTPFFATGGDALRVEDGGASLYVDAQHLSRKGVARLRPLFAPVFENERRKESGQ